MYWEEIVDLIGTHGDEPLSTYPNQYNDSDEYVVYLYERGTVKTKYVHIDEFSEKIKDCFRKYIKYDLENIQIFASLGASEGTGEHDDDGDVLIICLEGEMAYRVDGKSTVMLKPGDSILIEDMLLHAGISSTLPRICLSMQARRKIPKEEVTYYFSNK